jgi:hypothetical protein
MGRAFMLDDYRGDGTLWSHVGTGAAVGSTTSSDPDGLAYVDGILDVPQDYLEALLIVTWPGGVTNDPGFYFLTYYPGQNIVLGTIGVDGSFTATGVPFAPFAGGAVAAGVYALSVVLDGGNQVLPPVVP